MSIAGTHKARAREWALGHSSTGKEQVAVEFVLIGGEHDGSSITWYGYFTDGAVDRTLDSLRHCGWNGEGFPDLTGLDKNEVQLVIEQEEYQGQWHDKVKWVNKAGGVAMKDPMTPQQATSFAQRMKGKLMAHKATYGGPREHRPASNGRAPASQQRRGYAPPADESDDIPF